uniref:Uncharacterized protein n=1 Tax=Cannabis sativa TaxID=3483 RepID=A0A803QK37_CANSA
MSSLAAMASCSNSKRKILMLKESEPLVREVVQGIHAAFISSKKKAENIPLQKLVSTKPPCVIAQRCFTDIFGACVRYAYSMDNKYKKVVELTKKLEVVEDRVVATKDQVTALKEKINSLENFTLNGGESVVKGVIGVEGSNLEHPNFPPFVVDALVAESEDKDETIVDVISFKDVV